MRLFGLWITTEKTYRRYIQLETKTYKFWQVHRWFSGWRDLDIIWDYLIKDTNFGGIERARKDYAEARGTDEYGKIKKGES
jgi:hypothetical protein